jgi:hypothetical protein
LKVSQSLADVFIDTNILKFAAVKKHVYRLRKDTINWGGLEQEIEVHEPYIKDDLHKIKNEMQKRDAVLLAMLAYAGLSGRLAFHIHGEVDLEMWGLPGMVSASGRFFGCPIRKVADPISPQSRIIASAVREPKDYVLDFLCGIRHPRFIELTKMTEHTKGRRNR